MIANYNFKSLDGYTSSVKNRTELFVVTLPKIWINKIKILQNQEIGFISRQDQTLTIIPHPDQISLEREMLFHITPSMDLQLFYHELFASYIIGYSKIIITTEERISTALRDLVSESGNRYRIPNYSRRRTRIDHLQFDRFQQNQT